MLPSADLFEKCLRCGAPLGADDAVCKRCGADPTVERAAWAQLTPAIRDLRVIFLAVLVINGIGAWLIYDHLERHGVPGLPVVWPAIAVCGVMAVLWLLAPRAPLVTASIAMALVVADWLREIARDRLFALDPGPGLALRIIVVLALGFAIRAGLTVRRLRARPTALTTASPSA
jgi:hypothetical protein